MVWKQFQNQISRGTQGFGVFDGTNIFKTPKLKKMRGYLRNQNRQSDFLMFHHRQPTSTVNVKRAAHPFSSFDFFDVKYKNGKTKQRVKYVLVHNGHISNSKSLKIEHEKLGIKYSSVLDDGTFNDSESLMWDVALTLEGRQENLKAYGGMAFVVARLVDDEITHLYFAKNSGRPLNLWRGKEGVLLSSEGVGEGIKDHRLYTYNYRLNRLTNRYFRVPSFDPTYESRGWNNSTTTYTYRGIPENTRTSTPTHNRTYGEYNFYYDEEGNKVHYQDNSSTSYEAIKGVDYWIDKDGEIVWFNDNDDIGTARASELKLKGNLYGKTEDEITLEQYEQDWFLNNYKYMDDQEVQTYAIYADYMTKAEGVYADAYDLLDTDLSYYAAHVKSTKRDLILDLIQGAIDTMYLQPDWADSRSYDPAYLLPAADIKVFRQPQLLGAGQEG